MGDDSRMRTEFPLVIFTPMSHLVLQKEFLLYFLWVICGSHVCKDIGFRYRYII